MQDRYVIKRLFQFLMVRLKAIFNCLCYSFIFISIPYGAIKRLSIDGNIDPIPRFQFLMVRLKAKSQNKPLMKQKFQFLMVRLKVLFFLFSQMLHTNFNSLWCD